jgi:hypothetical protein
MPRGMSFGLLCSVHAAYSTVRMHYCNVIMVNNQRSCGIRIIRLALLGILIVSCASGPPAPIPWFNEEFKVEDRFFPQGVNFSIVREESSRHVDFEEYIVVSNTSSTPLYFQAISYWGGSIDELDEPCPNDNLCLKVVSSEAWQWDVLDLDDDPPWEYGWVLVDKYSQPHQLKLHKFGNSLGNSTYSILKVELRNEYSIGDRPRPDHVSVPLPQRIALPYIYGDEEMQVQITITYSLNGAYSSHKPFDPTYLYGICFGGIALIVIIVVIVLTRLFNMLLVRLAEKSKSL